MKKDILLNVSVPLIAILEEPEFISKIVEKDMETIFSHAVKNINQLYGAFSTNFSGFKYENEDSSILLWFNNLYKISASIRVGEAQDKDEELLTKEVFKRLSSLSIQLSLNQENENLIFSFEDGLFDIKLGSGKDKRLYRVSYHLHDSYQENALNLMEKQLGIIVEKEDLNTETKRVLH